MSYIFNNLKKKWLIFNHNTILFWSSIVFLVISIIYLIILSIINKNLKFPKEHPYLFIIETLSICILSSLIILISAYLRNDFSFVTIIKFIITSLKFGVIHILLQFSGFYDYIYKYNN